VDNKKNIARVYVASPYGFAESTKKFMEEHFYPAIKNARCEIIDPWRHSVSPKPTLPELMALGEKNADDIEKADGLVAALDGTDVDSGTAAEIGYAAGKKKWIIGYRGDFRQTGENQAVKVNLQVEYFIRKNGGTIVGTLDELTTEIGKKNSKNYV